MMSTVDEKNWNSLQKQLTTSRKKQQKSNPTYKENPFAPEFMKTKPINDKNSKKTALSNVNSKIAKPTNQTNRSEAQYVATKTPNQTSSFYTPLQTPRSHLAATPSKLNDPFGIYPLASKSPYHSARDTFLQHPNLESWGIQNQPVYDNYRFNPSPFLPVYNSITNKPQKPYVIAPKFRRPLFQPSSPIMTDYNDYNTRLNYIAAKPYIRPELSFDRDIPERDEHHATYSSKQDTPLKSDQYLKNAHRILKTTDNKKYDGTELFSTKFLEDLEYNFTPATSSVKPKSSYPKPEVRHPAVDEYIKNIKKQVNIIIPKRDYEDEPLINSYAIDLAETIYKQEVEKIIKELVEQSINEEYNQVYLYQRPIFNQIFEETTNSMIRKIVTDCLDEHRKQVEKVQTNEIKKVAKEKLVTNLMLDHMLTKVAQHGRVMAENEDINKLLDGIILDILLHTNNDVRKVRDKTLLNYPIKKFHLNSFMNVSLDILVAELSANLEEDMRELETYEQVTSKI